MNRMLSLATALLLSTGLSSMAFAEDLHKDRGAVKQAKKEVVQDRKELKLDKKELKKDAKNLHAERSDARHDRHEMDRRWNVRHAR